MTLTVIQKPPLVHVEGIVRVREIPDEWTEAQFIRYWKKLSQRGRERYTVFEHKNAITAAGLTNINNYLGNTSTIPGFALYFSVGTGVFGGFVASVAHLVNEIFRKVPTLVTIVGNQTDISTAFAAGDAIGTWTEAGLWGGTATSTLGSGTLNTYLAMPFVKPNQAYTVDYLLTRN